jgi:putative transcriptional regulator
MAIVRRSLVDIQGSRPRVDGERFRAASENVRLAASIAADPDLAPDVSGAPLPAEPRAIRAAAKMTQEQFAALLGIPVATLRNWEQSRHHPDPGAAALFRLMAKDLRHALKVLGQ